MRPRRADRWTMLAFAVIFAGLVAAYCSIIGLTVVRPAVDATPTPTVRVVVIPESPVPATQMPDIFTVPSPSPELVFATPLATATPTPEPTVAPTETPRPERSPVQRGGLDVSST